MNKTKIKAAIRKLDEVKAELLALLEDKEPEANETAQALPKQEIILSAFFDEFHYLDKATILNGKKESQRIADARKFLFYALHEYGFNLPESEKITGYRASTIHHALSVIGAVPDFQYTWKRLKKNIDKALNNE